MYASQGQISDMLHTEDIGYALSEDDVSTLPPHSIVNGYLALYDGIGYVLILVAYVTYTIALIRNKATQLQLSYCDNISLSTVVIGGAWMIFEFIETLRHIIQDSPMLIVVWVYTAIAYMTFLLPVSLRFMWRCIKRSKKSKEVCNICPVLHIATYLLLVYHFALPTFLLFLVHPMKVITTFAYLITAIFVAIIVCSAYAMIYKNLITYLKFKNIRFSFSRIFCLSLFALIYILVVVTVIFYLFVLYPLVYAVMLNQSSNISPIYTILSLVPSAAISFITWTLKNKLFHSLSIEELQNAEDTTEKRDKNDLNSDTEEERIPLLTVEENGSTSKPMSESSPNLRNHHNYGTTEVEDKSNETNC